MLFFYYKLFFIMWDEVPVRVRTDEALEWLPSCTCALSLGYT